MKKLKWLINWIIWGILFVVVLAVTLPQLPFVQQWMGRKMADIVSTKLGTHVSVGNVSLGFFNRMIVDDVIVLDQSRKVMLRVGRLSVRMELLPLAEGRVVVNSAQLFNAQAKLYRRDSLSKPNFQFVLDSLASRDTTSQTPFDLRIGSLIIRHSLVNYDQLDAPQTRGRFNPRHISLSDISAHMLLKVLTNDSINVNIKRLAAKEQSGIQVNKLALELEGGTQGARLSRFLLQLPHSEFNAEATVHGNLFLPDDDLRFHSLVSKTSITPADLAPLLPPLSAYSSPLFLRTEVSGSKHHLDVKELDVQSADGLTVNATGSLHNDGTLRWQTHVSRIAVTGSLLNTLSSQLSKMPDVLLRLGDVSLTGNFSGTSDGAYTAQGQISTGVGTADIDASLSSDRTIKGHVITGDLQLGTLLSSDQFGLVAGELAVNGTPQRMEVKGDVTNMDYNGYHYQDIHVDGLYSPEEVSGHLAIHDTNIETDIEGTLKQGRQTALKLTGYIRNLSPKALGLSSQWGNASFSATVNADFTASSMNDAQGSIDIDDFQMKDSTVRYRFDNLHVQSGYDSGLHYLKLQGDMGEAELRGHFDWETIPQSFIGSVASILPTLPGLPRMGKASENDFSVKLQLTDSEWLRHLLGIDVTLSKPAVVYASVNDALHDVSLSGHMPFFTYNNSSYENCNIHITTPGDSLKCEASVGRLSDDDDHRMDLQLNAIAADNKVEAHVYWDNKNPSEAVNGRLSTVTQFYKNEAGRPEAHVSILPSQATMGQAQWNIEPSDILYGADRLLIDHFSVAHDDQHILIDGIASHNPHDTLTIDLNRVGVAYVLDLVNFTAVSFDGEATGSAFVTQAFGTPQAWAQLRVDGFKFEGGRMGTLQAHAEWNNRDSQIDIRAVANDGPDAATYIDGFVSPSRDCIDLGIRGRGTYIDFLHSFTNSFLSSVTGHAHGDVRLIGPLGEMDLLGQLVVDGQAKVKPLGTTYLLQQDTVRLVHDDILLDSLLIYDTQGNKAVFSGGIHHKNLTQLTFDLNVDTDKLLSYDIPNTPDELFYGTVMAEGHVDMHGRPGEVVINCTATPLSGTTFTYNVSNPDAISDQSFISWQVRGEEDSRPAPPSDPQQREPADDVPTDLYINFLLNTNDQATLRLLMDSKTHDYITLGGNGVIRASYHNKGAFQMFGTYTVERGTYDITIQNIIKRNFQFQPGGTIVFGGNPLDAGLNLQALYTVNGVSLSDLSIGNSFTNNSVRVNCLMNIQGQANAPQVDFDLDMPSVNTEEKQMIRSVITSEQEMNQQVLYLLGVGRFYTQGANNEATQRQYDQTQLAMQSFLSGTMSTQINEVLSQVLKTNNWNFGANISTGNEGWHNAEYEGMVSGQMLDNRLLINGQFGYRDNATQATPSFIGDFDVRYLLTPNGNLALKVYNQTNDRYFTRSSLNTQGIGLIMKKDFNGLGDLFSPRKRRLQTQ